MQYALKSKTVHYLDCFISLFMNLFYSEGNEIGKVILDMV